MKNKWISLIYLDSRYQLKDEPKLGFQIQVSIYLKKKKKKLKTKIRQKRIALVPEILLHGVKKMFVFISIALFLWQKAEATVPLFTDWPNANC